MARAESLDGEDDADDADDEDDDVDDDADGDAEWEEHFRQMVEARFIAEAEAYRRLSDMQGGIIPRCYASVHVVPPAADSQVPEALVYGLILKEIDGVDLTEFDPSTSDYTSLGHALMAAVSTFPSYGVVHHDIRSHNILISPTRIALIDFGEATLRNEGMCDNEWDVVQCELEVQELRLVLNNGRIRDSTPADSRFTGTDRFLRSASLGFSARVRQYSEKWKRRWYNKVLQPEGIIGLEWSVKDEVATWLDSRPPPPQCFLVPRPGSPESHVPKLEFAWRAA